MNDKPIPHGTTTGYARGCRCDDCRSALAAYQRKRQAAMRDGTWVPWAHKAEPKKCTGPDCDRRARYITPVLLCAGHMQQRAAGKKLAPLKRKRYVKNGMKECRLCGLVKPVGEFQVNTASNNVRSECRVCTSIYHRAWRYGFTFDAMKLLMQSPCAGCGATDLTGHDLHVDHCHDTGKVRGVLCHNCNTVLTKHMTPETLRRLADYLEAST